MICPGCFKDKGESPRCPECSYDESSQRSSLYLPFRTLLSGQYLVGRPLGEPGGFGLTYLAWDQKLETLVAIKEFFPRDLVERDRKNNTVIPHSGEEGEIARFGLEQFLQEARTLAKFDHPNIMRVRTFFEENATAYLVMDYVEGISLTEFLRRRGGRIDAGLATQIMMPILDGLQNVHEKGYLHRDVKPHNIYLRADRRPVLLDFGAARFALGERSRSLSVILTPGFAPFEQYHRKGDQGPWSDIYAAAATLYFMVTGEAPPDSFERVRQDRLRPPQQLVSNVSPSFSSAVMKGLAMEPAVRPQNVRAFQELLSGSHTRLDSIDVPGAAASTRPAAVGRSRARTPVAEDRRSYPLVKALAIGLPLIAVMIGVVLSEPPRTAVRRDARFILLTDGTVQDVKLRLVWAASDCGENVTWQEAKAYCESFSRGGRHDWRMPTVEELESLYDRESIQTSECDSNRPAHVSNLLRITCSSVWSGELMSGKDAALFDFADREARASSRESRAGNRALPVRSNPPGPASMKIAVGNGRAEEGEPQRGAEDTAAKDTRTESTGPTSDYGYRDRNLGLMWAPRDNGQDIGWYDAWSYCKSYDGGGYRDWRLPTAAELYCLYVSGQEQPEHMPSTVALSMPCCVWTANRADPVRSYRFGFLKGRVTPYSRIDEQYARVLPVRTYR